MRIPAALAAALLLVAAGCGGEETSPVTTAGPDAGSGGAIADAGPAPQPCPAGELPADGGCVKAGSTCGPGFVDDGSSGCDAVLPAAPCTGSTMALPGETQCRKVADCGAGAWGDAPVDASTRFVDASYAGADADGSETKPFPTIQQAVAAASPGDLVAVAAGSYVGPVVVDRPLRLWGACPDLVEIAGTSHETLIVDVRAGGVEVHDLAVTGPGVGIGANGAPGVLVDRAWIHDTDNLGAMAQYAGGPCSYTLARSLVDHAGGIGFFGWGSDVTIEDSVIRDTASAKNGGFGRGIGVSDDPGNGVRSKLSVRRASIEHNREWGVVVWGTDLTVEDTSITGTEAADDGTLGVGIEMRRGDDGGERTVASLRGVVVDGSALGGVVVFASDVDLADLTVKNTRSQESDGAFGSAIIASGDELAEGSASLVVTRASLHDDRAIGLVALGADVTLESVLVARTEPQEADAAWGWGALLGAHPVTRRPTVASLRGVVLEDHHAAGLAISGSSATLESVLVRRTQSASLGALGVGVVAELDLETFAPSELTMRASRVEDSRSGGVVIAGTAGILEDVEVVDTKPELAGQHFGDGIVVETAATNPPVPATLRCSRCRVARSARAGIVSFGGAVTLDHTELVCNGIDLDGEEYGQPFAFDDAGGNVCRCGDEIASCSVLSSDLSPPSAVDGGP